MVQRLGDVLRVHSRRMDFCHNFNFMLSTPASYAGGIPSLGETSYGI